MVTRGLKSTPYQDPRMTVGAATIVIIAEHKQASPDVIERGVRLATVHVRRGPADVQDPKINSHSKLNCILACIQATKAGADEALMLDPHGFVATCNSTHFFIVRDTEVWTSSGNYCLAGITRANIIAVSTESQYWNGISACSTSTPPTRLSSPALLPAWFPRSRWTGESSAVARAAR
jgi:branched-chain amino acid aminotransferase